MGLGWARRLHPQSARCMERCGSNKLPRWAEAGGTRWVRWGRYFFCQYLATFWPMFPDRISWAENIVVGRLRGVWECGWGDDRKPVNVLGQYQWTNVAVWRTLRIWVACSDLIGFCGKFLQLLQRTPIAPANSYCSSDLLPITTSNVFVVNCSLNSNLLQI